MKYIVICSKKNSQIGNDYNNIDSAENASRKQCKKCKCSCCGIMSKESFTKS